MKKMFVAAFVVAMCISANGMMKAEGNNDAQLLAYSSSSNYSYVKSVKPWKKQGAMKIENKTELEVYTDGTYYYILIDGGYVQADYDYDMGAYSFYWKAKRGTWYFNV